jgi:hypothetical protein
LYYLLFLFPFSFLYFHLSLLGQREGTQTISSFIFYHYKVLSFLRCQAGPSRCNEYEPSLTENWDKIDLAPHRPINTKLHRCHLGISIPKSICVPSCALAPWQPPLSSVCNSKRRHHRRCISSSLGN